MENYIKGETLGEGTFGIVFKARHKETGQVVAIKKIRLGKAKEGVNVTALREIKLLRELDSPHIVRLLDVFPHKQNLNLVFEFMESDLEALIRDRSIIISPPDIKAYMRMGLQALDFCHSRWVLHRDIKPNNFLMSATGEMKLADFGLSRVFASPDPQYTNQVFSRWYRAPELLFGSTLYGPGVDIWGLGCVFAELLLRRPWLPGNSDIDQLSRIFQALGTPTTAQWPRVRDLPQFVEFQPSAAPPLRATFRQASEDALDLLSRMVAYDPARRITAAEALKHRYFRSEPAATPPERLPRPPVKAHHPLAASTLGGSAIQQAPGEGISQEGQDTNGTAALDVVDGVPDSGHAKGGSAPSSTGGYTSNGGGKSLHPQCKDEDMRYLRKRKLFSDDGVQTPGTSAV